MACRAVRRLKNSDAEPTAANAIPFTLGLFNKHGNRKKEELPGVHITVCIATFITIIFLLILLLDANNRPL